MLLFAGVLCLTYYVAIGISIRKWNSTFARFWPAAGAVLIICWYLERKQLFPLVLKWGMAFLLLLGLAALCCIIKGMLSVENVEYDYLIVLGAQVRGRAITDSLERRLEAALKYAKAHQRTKLIVSGGQGRGEDIPEAEAMELFLSQSGIEAERILVENKSRTTEENLEFSKVFLNLASDKVGIVSNNFHLYRALTYAKRQGYTDVHPVSAGCHPVLLVNYIVREMFAVWKLWLSR